jgi:hypothetical protein
MQAVAVLGHHSCAPCGSCAACCWRSITLRVGSLLPSGRPSAASPRCSTPSRTSAGWRCTARWSSSTGASGCEAAAGAAPPLHSCWHRAQLPACPTSGGGVLLQGVHVAARGGGPGLQLHHRQPEAALAQLEQRASRVEAGQAGQAGFRAGRPGINVHVDLFYGRSLSPRLPHHQRNAHQVNELQRGYLLTDA